MKVLTKCNFFKKVCLIEFPELSPSYQLLSQHTSVT